MTKLGCPKTGRNVRTQTSLDKKVLKEQELAVSTAVAEDSEGQAHVPPIFSLYVHKNSKIHNSTVHREYMYFIITIK